MMMGFGILLMLAVLGVPVLLLILLIRPLNGQGSIARPTSGAPTTTTFDLGSCSHCGAKLRPEWMHCPQCGAPAQVDV
jgi:hypothetical protein